MPKGNEHAPVSTVPLAKRARATLLVGSAIVAYALVVGSGVVRCPLAAMFHVPCPTCGATRSTLALLSLDFSGAMLNPVAPPLVVLLGVLSARLVFVAARDGHTRRFDEAPAIRGVVKAIFVLLLVAIALWIVRFFGVLGGPVPV